MKPLNQLTNTEIMIILKQQSYLEREVDIDYEMWRLGISFVEFMERNLWSKLTKLNEMEGQENMSKIIEFAKGYEQPKATKNIADLSEVSTDLELEDDEYEYLDKPTGKPVVVKQKVICLNKEKYRVPVSVIQQLKIILEDNPNLKKFKVKRSGSTKDDTRYQVIPLS